MTWGELQKERATIACRCRSCERALTITPETIRSIAHDASLSEAVALLTCRGCKQQTIEVAQ